MTRLLAAWALVAASTACGVDLDAPAPSLSKAKPQSVSELDVEAWEAVPVPEEDGAKLAPLSLVAPVYGRPEKSSKPIGYLRLGARVARSDEPVGTQDCPEGWYAIRPVGFVCAGRDFTLRLEHPLAKAIQVEPDRSKPMPYKYAFVRAIAPNYLKVPSTEEQFKYEMRLERHLRNWKKLHDEWDHLDVGANDVPLDENGLARDTIPDHAVPMDMSERYGGDGRDEIPWWLDGERRIANVSGFRAPTYAVIADRIKRHGGVALIGTFVAGEKSQNRRFAISTDARLLPADKLKADSGSPFHGGSIREVGLPAAFAYSPGTHLWTYEGGKLSRGEQLPHRKLVPLTGRVKRLRGVRMVETRSGHWLRSKDLKTVKKPSKLPWYATHKQKWIDISLIDQTMVLWEGASPVYATLVSSGRDGLGDPKKTLSTPQGTFRIYQKHVTTTMDSNAADKEFELRDVPWVMYFKGGYALHAAYWHDDFGKTRSHGCVNLSPIDARYTFMWSLPDVPQHWHAAYSGETFGKGTLVNVHP